MKLTSKVRSALGIAIIGCLGALTLGVTGALEWVGVLAACIAAVSPVVAAWFTTETVAPPA